MLHIWMLTIEPSSWYVQWNIDSYSNNGARLPQTRAPSLKRLSPK
jgi:hypothetical protein